MCSLTDEEAGGDLCEELRRQDARPLEQAHFDFDDETDASARTKLGTTSSTLQTTTLISRYGFQGR
jgi:hypothetical protein